MKIYYLFLLFLSINSHCCDNKLSNIELFLKIKLECNRHKVKIASNCVLLAIDQQYFTNNHIISTAINVH